MRQPTTFIAIAILALMLGACASTNDPVEPTTAENTTELPSMAEKQTQIAYTDISADASTKQVVVTETQVLDSNATVTQSTDPTMTSSTTLTSSLDTDNTATMSGTTSSNTTSTTSTTNSSLSNRSMASSSTTDDTDDDDDDTVATRTRLRKD